jgi:hypothetical protein
MQTQALLEGIIAALPPVPKSASELPWPFLKLGGCFTFLSGAEKIRIGRFTVPMRSPAVSGSFAHFLEAQSRRKKSLERTRGE